jgi:hypothetical protein
MNGNASSAPESASPGALRGLGRNLLAGLRIALFLPLRAGDLRASPGQYALLVAFNLVAWLAVSALETGFEGELNPLAIPVFLVNVPLVLATALAVARIYRAEALLTLVAVGLTSSDTWFTLAGTVFNVFTVDTALGDALPSVLLAWIWLAALRAVAVCAGTARPRFYFGALAASVMVAAAFFAVPKVEVWIAAEEETEVPALAEERVFHAQGELIERELAALRPSRPALPELYFVGFAPDGREDVFLRELRYVKNLFDERYGTLGRSIALVNNDRSLEQYPLATATNLRRVLERVGMLMNPDKDALFLFITGHGDEEHRLSAWQPPLQLDELTPTALGRMLQDAGLKWKIVVISACYSGAYLQPLRDDDSLIITASAENRASFGCQQGNEFTWFGRAYFERALGRTRSFAEAFGIARDIVAQQEAKEKVEPSMPQMWLGPAIEHRLKLYGGR